MDESLGINDECIDFWWDKVQQLSPECQESEEGVIFICPSAMYMVNTTDNLENLGEILADLNLHRKGLILMPVNDYLSNTASGTARGTHWSLLCYIRTQNQFRLYDSLGRHNHARRGLGDLIGRLRRMSTQKPLRRRHLLTCVGPGMLREMLRRNS